MYVSQRYYIDTLYVLGEGEGKKTVIKKENSEVGNKQTETFLSNTSNVLPFLLLLLLLSVDEDDDEEKTDITVLAGVNMPDSTGGEV